MEEIISESRTAAPGRRVERLKETVIDGGFCVGCGACAAIKGSSLAMRLDEYGRYTASLVGKGDDPDVLSICPFSESGPDENGIAAARFPRLNNRNSHLGFQLSNWAGHVIETPFRHEGSSGGFGTWILHELLHRKLVESIVHVKPRKPTADDPRLYAYGISRTAEELSRGARSHYHAVEMSGVVEQIRSQPGPCAFVGIPCFIKALLRLCRTDSDLADRVRFTVGLFCGHLKSVRFGEMLAWQTGIPPVDLESVNFRKKLLDRPASDYGIEAAGVVNGERIVRSAPVRELYGSNWGLGFFKLKACDYCDDVVAETADVSVGDAWLPQYVTDPLGTNVLVVRNEQIDLIIREGVSAGRLAFSETSPDEIIRSQAGGFHHRRQGLSYRLALLNRAGMWTPPKRVAPDHQSHSANFRLRMRLRIRLAAESHAAYDEARTLGKFDVFRRRMDPLIARHAGTYATPPSLENTSLPRRFRGMIGRLRRRMRGAVKALLESFR